MSSETNSEKDDRSNNSVFGQTIRQSARSKQLTRRFGISETDENDDDLFVAADLGDPDEQLDSVVIISTETTVSDPLQQPNVNAMSMDDTSALSPGELIIYRKLCKVESDCNRLEKRLRSIEENVEINKAKEPVNQLDKATLLEFGLPMKTEQALNDFEFNLLNVEFETKLV